MVLFSASILIILITVVTGKEFEYVSKSMAACDAQVYCEENYAGNLASIDSEAENDAVAALCEAKQCLIGLENRASSSSSFWMNGEQVTYENWGKNEPNNQDDQPNVIIKSKDKTWRTVSKLKLPFVCEKNTPEYVTIHQTQFQIYGDRLFPNERITTGQALVDKDRRYVAALQADGNFVIYDLLQDDANLGPGKAVWDTSTHQFTSDNKRYLIFQPGDGNVVIYSGGDGSPNQVNQPRWATNKYDNNPGFFVMQTDGNLVAYNAQHVAYWDRMGCTLGNCGVEFLYNQDYGVFLTKPIYMDTNWMIMTGIIVIIFVICGIFHYRRSREKGEYQSLLQQV